METTFDPGVRLVEGKGSFRLEVALDTAWLKQQKYKLVSSRLLGRATIPDMKFEQTDGTEIRIDKDYFGAKRRSANPFPGPFEARQSENRALIVWPVRDSF